MAANTGKVKNRLENFLSGLSQAEQQGVRQGLESRLGRTVGISELRSRIDSLSSQLESPSKGSSIKTSFKPEDFFDQPGFTREQAFAKAELLNRRRQEEEDSFEDLTEDDLNQVLRPTSEKNVGFNFFADMLKPKQAPITETVANNSIRALQELTEIENEALKQNLDVELIKSNREAKLRNLAIQELEVNGVPVSEAAINAAKNQLREQLKSISQGK